MNESELKSLLASEEKAAIGYLTGDLSTKRKKAMDYYNGEPFGNEIKDRSSVVSTDVANTIEWIMPALLEMFASGDKVVEAGPNGEEDVESAEQATDYANYAFMRDNNGFLILYQMFKDALLQITGSAKVYWESQDKVETTPFASIPFELYTVQSAEKIAQGFEERDTKQEPQPDGTVLFSGTWRRERKVGKVCITPLPPEQLLVSKDAGLDIEKARYVAHRTQKTASDLIKEGYPKAKIDKIPADEIDDSAEKLARDRDIDDDEMGEGDVNNNAMRKIWVTEAYIKVDWDNDGIAEMRKVVHAGAGTVILSNDEWEGPRPIASITPIIMSHRFHGRSVADLVMDLQLIKSTLWRQILDNLYLSNNAQKVVDPDSVELDDLLVSRPGGIIRTRNGAKPGDVYMGLEVPNVAQQSYPMLEYIDSVLENRTGVTRYNQGVDADSLNKTASGITQIMSAAQQRIKLIARIFAETGVKRMFELIIWNLRQYPEEAKRTIRLRNKQWVPMDPAGWGGDYDLLINVGLGTGNKDQMGAHLTNLLDRQGMLMQMQGGPEGPLVGLKNIRHTFKLLVENSGFKDSDNFVASDEDVQMLEAQPPGPGPQDPAMMEMEQAAQRQQGEFELKRQGAMADQQLKRDVAIADHGLKREIADRDAAARETEAAQKQRDSEGTDNLVKAIMGLAAVMVKSNQETAQVILQGQQQQAESNALLFKALTAPTVMTTPDNRQYTAKKAVNA